MIGQVITDKSGKPLENYGNKLSPSNYNPSDEVLKLFGRVQTDYQAAYSLQHRTFQEFDGLSLLQRAKLDQETFGAYVGAEYLPVHKKWRWRGRKNTARNKIMGILAHIIAGMLYPFVHAKNEENEEDKMTARVMRILVEDHLRKADYEMKFMYMALTALVNPAVFCEVQYVEAMQTVKQKMRDGSIKIIEAVDQLMSGLNLNIVPIEELMLSDFYTGDLQKQPYLIRVKRISYDTARKIYGKHKDFKYVQAGKTRVVLAGQENQTLFDIEWTEADKDFVQELTAYYRDEDLQVCWLGGVFMGEDGDVYNSNPFEHRRLTIIGGEVISIPIYPFAKSGFEPIDPTGRFAYYKSAAFKEYWDDQALNTMHRLVLDGTYLDVFKPLFISGVAKVDSIVIAPGVSVGMPKDAQIAPFSIGSNLTAAYTAIAKQEEGLSESTQDKTSAGIATPNITATQTAIATQQAKVALGNFGAMIGNLIKDIGELTVDCVIQYATQGEVDTTVPEALSMKFRTYLVKDKQNGKDITNRVIFTDKYMGKDFSQPKIDAVEWDLYDKAGGYGSDQRIYEVDPYKFARYTYACYVDVDMILDNSMGNTQQKKTLAFNMLTDPRIIQFTDAKAVADSVIDEFAPLLSQTDPDKFKNKSLDMMNPMGMGAPDGAGNLDIRSPMQNVGAGAVVTSPLSQNVGVQ